MDFDRINTECISHVFIFSAILLSTTLLPLEIINAQVPVDHQGEIEVMILGTTHFGNPGQDVINIEFPDVLQPKYQSQIDRVIENLSEFQPTKITIEAKPEYKPKVDSMYNAYLSGEHSLSRNERQQLGFKLAGQMNHNQVYSIDHGGNFPFQSVLDFAKKHQPKFIENFQEIRDYVERSNKDLVYNSTITEILRQREFDIRILKKHQLFRVDEGGFETGFLFGKVVSDQC